MRGIFLYRIWLICCIFAFIKITCHPMRKSSVTWIQHDSHTLNHRGIKAMYNRYGGKGYGVWWWLQEVLAVQPNYQLEIITPYVLEDMAYEMRVEYDWFSEWLKDCLYYFKILQTDTVYLWCDDLNERMAYWDEKRKILSERGKKGAAVTNAKRWGTENQAEVVEEKVRLSEAQATDLSAQKKRKQKKREENKRKYPYGEVVFSEDIQDVSVNTVNTLTQIPNNTVILYTGYHPPPDNTNSNSNETLILVRGELM
jgi:hypothetical protein